jgi:HemY protein
MTRAARAKPDPTWTADGFMSDRWMPVSPVTGRLDAFQWKDPIGDLDADEALIEHVREVRAPVAAAPATPAPPVTEIKPLEPRPVESAAVSPLMPAGRGLARTATAAAPVVPLIHVPDDPGPDPQPQLEPETAPSDSSNDSWRKLRGLFK